MPTGPSRVRRRSAPRHRAPGAPSSAYASTGTWPTTPARGRDGGARDGRSRYSRCRLRACGLGLLDQGLALPPEVVAPFGVAGVPVEGRTRRREQDDVAGPGLRRGFPDGGPHARRPDRGDVSAQRDLDLFGGVPDGDDGP